jgi:hypothetical protein
MLNTAIGLIAIACYLANVVTGIYALKTYAPSRVAFSGVWFSSISALCFAVLYPEYLLRARYQAVGESLDLIWAGVHVLSSLGVFFLHLGLIRVAKKTV